MARLDRVGLVMHIQVERWFVQLHRGKPSAGTTVRHSDRRRHAQGFLRYWWLVTLVVLIVLAGTAAYTHDRQLRTDQSPPSSLVLSSSLAPQNLQPGGEARLSLRVRSLVLPADVDVLITYADGSTQYFEERLATNPSTITWRVPSNAPAGQATFRFSVLTTCECNITSLPSGGATEGHFQVVARTK